MKALSPSVCKSRQILHASRLPRWKWPDVSVLINFVPAVVVGAAMAWLAILAINPGGNQFERVAAAWLGQAGLLLVASAWLAQRLSTMLELAAAGLAVAVMALAGMSQPGLLPLAALLSAFAGILAVPATGHRQLFVGWVVFHVVAALVLALT